MLRVEQVLILTLSSRSGISHGMTLHKNDPNGYSFKTALVQNQYSVLADTHITLHVLVSGEKFGLVIREHPYLSIY